MPGIRLLPDRSFSESTRQDRQNAQCGFLLRPFLRVLGTGANENMNGLIREFFPKKMRFDSITKNDIALAMHRLNHRPRKCLGFRTPHEVFMEQLHFHLEAVALQS